MENYSLIITLLFVTLLPSTRPSDLLIQLISPTPDEIPHEFNAPQEHTFVDIFTGIRSPNASKVNEDNYHPIQCVSTTCSPWARSRRKIDPPNTRFRRDSDPFDSEENWGSNDLFSESHDTGKKTVRFNLDPGQPEVYQQFIDIHEDGSRSVHTEKFLEVLDEARTANNFAREIELVEMARYTQEALELPLTGDYKSLFNDVTKVGSLTEFLGVQSNDISYSESMKLTEMNKPSMAKHYVATVAGLLPMAEGLYHLINICTANTSSSECHMAELSFGLGAGFLVTTLAAPPIFERIIRANMQNQIKSVSTLWAEREVMHYKMYNNIATASKMLSIGFLFGNVGFEFWGIYQSVSRIIDCLHNRNECPDETLHTLILSIGLAVVRVLIIIALFFIEICPILATIIFLSIWLLEKFFTALISYSAFRHKFDLTAAEGFETFIHNKGSWALIFIPFGIFIKVIGMAATKSGLEPAMKRAGILTETANKVIGRYFNESSESLVAVAYALGNLESEDNPNNITTAKTIINMTSFTEIPRNRILHRVQPDELPNTMRLCLPIAGNSRAGGWIKKPIETAQFYCENAVVIGRKGSWSLPNVSVYPPPKKKGTSNGQIMYLLQYAEPAEIIGNDFYDNYVMVDNSFTKITGGASSNIYDLRQVTLKKCEFIFHTDASDDRLILTNVWNSPSPLVKSFGKNYVEFHIEFKLIGDMIIGHYRVNWYYKNIIKWKVSLKPPESPRRSKTFVGIPNQPEYIQCADNHMLEVLKYNYSLQVSMGGGISTDRRDKIINCHRAELFPFSDYEFRHNGIRYLVVANLKEISHGNHQLIKTTSAIRLFDNAQMVFQVNGAHIFDNTLSMKYLSKDNKFIWDMVFSKTTFLTLEIYGFYRNYTEQEKARMNTNYDRKAQAVEILEEHHMGPLRYYLEMPTSDEIDDDTAIDVKELVAYGELNGTTLDDATRVYRKFAKEKNGYFNVSLALNSITLQQIFYFGTNSANTIRIDGNFKYIIGGNGKDSYVLFPTAPEYLWIDNQASDNEMDTLVIPDGLCDDVTVERYTGSLSAWDKSDKDVVVKCTSHSSSRRINVIIKHYILNGASRHLLIFYKQIHYAILVDKSVYDSSEIIVSLGQYIDMQKKHLITNIGSTSHLVLLHVLDKNIPFEAHVQDKNIVLQQEGDNSGLVRLIDVYRYLGERSYVFPAWMDKVFVVVDDAGVGRHMNWTDIERLVARSSATNKEIWEEEMKSRYVFLDKANKPLLRIDHDSLRRFKSIKIPGILDVRHIMPANLHAKWDSARLELQICATNSCVIIENWCEGWRHRLTQIELNPQFKSDTISIPDLEFLDCESPYASNQDKLINNLNTNFQYAQKLAEYSANSASDSESFKRCILSSYGYMVTPTKPTAGLFGFINMYARGMYLEKRCKNVIKLNLLENLTQSAMIDMFEANILKYEPFRQINYRDISDEMRLKAEAEEKSIDFIRKSLTDTKEWYKFKYRMYKLFILPSMTSSFEPNFEEIDILNAGRYDEAPWYDRLLVASSYCE